MAHYDLKTEQLKEMAPKLRAGDTVTLTGTVYTCLLYTSPSPRDRQKSRMPSSA